MRERRDYLSDSLAKPVGDRLSRYSQERYPPEPEDERPILNVRWPGFVSWVEQSVFVHPAVITRDGFASAGYILWAAYLAGARA